MSDFDIKHYARESKKAVEQLITENDQLRAENEALKSDYTALQSEYRKQNDVEAALVKAIDELKQRAEAAERERDEAHGWIARAMMNGCCGEDVTRETLQGIIDKRDIEQQIKGIEWVIKNECMGWYELNRIQRRIKQLRKQLDDNNAD